MSKEMCGFCQLKRRRRNQCQAPEAEPLRFSPEVFAPHECRHYSCGEGLRAAKKILKSVLDKKRAERVMASDGSEHEGYPFGSTDKPHGDTGRLVTKDGRIITYSEKTGQHYVSPQKVPAKK